MVLFVCVADHRGELESVATVLYVSSTRSTIKATCVRMLAAAALLTTGIAVRAHDREPHKRTVLLSPQDWPYPDLPQDEPGQSESSNGCVSIAAGATDFWCQSTCTGSYCPADLCRCGDGQANGALSELQAAGTSSQLERPASQAPQRNRDGVPIAPGGHGDRRDDASEKECKSVDATTTDVWCSTTCVNANNCPPTLCKCTTFTGKRLRVRREEQLRVCDFDAKVCVGTGGGAIDCRPCEAHISTCMSTTHFGKDKQVLKVTLGDCLDEVAGLGEECSACNSTESNKAYQLRLGTWQGDDDEEDASTDGPAEADARVDPDETDPGVLAWQTYRKREKECKSLDAQATDHWCQTTCAGAAENTCPRTLCECKVFSGEQLKKRAAEQKRTCDFDAQACVGSDCRSCDAHISTCKGTTHLDKAGGVKPMAIEDCMDEVAESAADGCSMCNTTESKKAYKVRLGIPSNDDDDDEDAS